MNADFLFAQLRVFFIAAIAWCGGKGYFTPADSAFALAAVTGLLPIAVPWLTSIYATYGTKKVPQDSIAVKPVQIVDTWPAEAGQMVQAHSPDATLNTDPTFIGKIVGALLFGILLFAPSPSFAQNGPLQNLRATVIADLTAARDDAKSNDDPAEQCWALLLKHAEEMPPKLMGVAHTAQRLRTLRRALPKISDACAVVKDGARQAIAGIFGAAASAGVLGALGL